MSSPSGTLPGRSVHPHPPESLGLSVRYKPRPEGDGRERGGNKGNEHEQANGGGSHAAILAGLVEQRCGREASTFAEAPVDHRSLWRRWSAERSKPAIHRDRFDAFIDNVRRFLHRNQTRLPDIP